MAAASMLDRTAERVSQAANEAATLFGYGCPWAVQARPLEAVPCNVMCSSLIALQKPRDPEQRLLSAGGGCDQIQEANLVNLFHLVPC